MPVCLDCKWNPEKKETPHCDKCIKRNEGKVVKDCDCQHRSYSPSAEGGDTGLISTAVL